jgi:hypothetical protein
MSESYLVRMMLMRRSQLQPVMAKTAAGGKMIATRMRTTSEPLTMVVHCSADPTAHQAIRPSHCVTCHTTLSLATVSLAMTILIPLTKPYRIASIYVTIDFPTAPLQLPFATNAWSIHHTQKGDPKPPRNHPRE